MLLDGLPEGAKQVRAFAVLDHILRELANVEIERDEVVDVRALRQRRACSDFLVALAAGDDLAPGLGGQRIFGRSRLVPDFPQRIASMSLDRSYVSDGLMQRGRVQAAAISPGNS